MATITFLSTDIETKKIEFGLDEKMKDVCKKYAQEINKNIKQLVFYSNGKKLIKKMTVSEFNKSNPKNELFVVKMNENVDSESEEEKKEKEKEKANSKKLKEEIIDSIKNDKKEITYEKTQELIVQYGFDSKKRIEEEKKEHPENFIEIEEAIKKKDEDEKLYVLGQLGKSLKEMGIEVAIDKTEGKNIDDSLIVNQFISSGILEERKYEIHYKDDDIDVNEKYEIISNRNGKQGQFIEKMKEFLSKNIGVPKEEIFIGNIREGCLAFDAISKKQNIREKMEKLAEQNAKIEMIYEKNILEACKLTKDMLDVKGNRKPKEWPKSEEKRGGMTYYPPSNNWVGYGLKVLGKYDDGNNDWIAMDNNKNEWAVAYHGTSTEAVEPICKEGGKFFSTFKEGAKHQKCKDYININKNSQNLYKICKEGAYASPKLDYAEKYCGKHSSPAMIMCRVNPNKIRIPDGEYGKNEYITDGTRNTIRPYRILVKLNNK